MFSNSLASHKNMCTIRTPLVSNLLLHHCCSIFNLTFMFNFSYLLYFSCFQLWMVLFVLYFNQSHSNKGDLGLLHFLLPRNTVSAIFSIFLSYEPNKKTYVFLRNRKLGPCSFYQQN